MPCPSFEDLLLDYAELAPAERGAVDAHLAGCADCREYLETLAHLETGLSDLYAGAQVSPSFRNEVLSIVERPSLLPEILDFIGWAGIIAGLACLAPLLRHFHPELTSVALVCAAGAIFAGVWAAVDEGRLDY
jgi:predicted anti-sigma-YlaC factor YlaD